MLRWAPLDRARAKLNLWGSKDPFLGIPSVIEAPAFDRPPARIFRIVESPRYIAADAELAKHLSKVTKKAIGPIEDVTDASVFNEGYAKQKPFVVKDPRAAADAYGRLSRGEQGSRKAVLQHPLYALALALDVDREPRDDTRAAACGHPTTAVQYAVMVDRGPHESTRKAADGEVTSVHRYATSIDRVMSDALVARMEKSGYWNPGSARAFQAELAANRTDGPRQVATRTLPKPIKAPRFDKKSPIADPEMLSEIDEMLAKGLKLIGAAASDPVPEIIDKLHAYADDVRHGEVKAIPRLYLALGCVLGEQLHRAFGWSWGTVRRTTPGLFSPNRAHTHIAFMLTQRVAKEGAKANTIALFFNMVADGNLPKSKPSAACLVT
ncbi:MAG: hypothetical protein M3619_16185 [Myxococcota bacterium]|nr:hypothetical protein [Myxococcota bacterium]